MSTLRICIELGSNAGESSGSAFWTVSIVRYGPDWTPHHWRDEPPAGAIVSLHSRAMSGVSRELADCYAKAFNVCELKRPKRCWAVRREIAHARR